MILNYTLKKLKENITFDLRMLAIFRICLGIILFIDVIDRAKDIEIFYSDNGALPLSNLYALTAIRSGFSLNLINGSVTFQILLLLVMGILSLMLIIGLKTRLTTILLWIFIVSIHNRNMSLLQGGDDLIRLVTFWSILLPLGAKYSIDRFLIKQEPESNKYLSLNVLAFVLQICFVYFFASILKSSPIWNQDFTAGSYVYQIEMFTKHVGRIFYNFPELLKLMTFFVYYLERYISILLLFPFFNKYTRTFGALLIIVMQFGFGFTMELGPFPWISMAVMIPLISPEVFLEIWDLTKKIFRKDKNETVIIQILYNLKNKKQFITIRFIQSFFGLNNIKYVINTRKDNKKGLFTIIKDNYEINGYDAFLEILSYSTFFRSLKFLFKFSIIKKLTTKFYYFILKINVKFKSTEFNFYSFINIAISTLTSVIFISWIFAWNMNSVIPDSYQLSTLATNSIYFLKLEQKWSMFSPYPFTDDGWFVIMANTKGNDRISIFGNKEKTSLDKKPVDIANTFPNERWRKYFTNLYDNNYLEYRRLFLDYLCKKSNNDNYNDQYKSIDMYYILTRIISPTKKEEPKKLLLLSYECK